MDDLRWDVAMYPPCGGVEAERGDCGAPMSASEGEVDDGLGVGPTDAQGDDSESAGDVDKPMPTPPYLQQWWWWWKWGRTDGGRGGSGT